MFEQRLSDHGILLSIVSMLRRASDAIFKSNNRKTSTSSDLLEETTLNILKSLLFSVSRQFLHG